MEIIIELSLCINLFLNSLILKLSALLLKDQARLWFFSALIGATIALILPLFSLSWYLKLLIIIFTCALMCSISFKYISFKRFSVVFAVIMLATFLFGGGCYALQSLVGQFPLFIVAIVSGVIYVVTKIIIRGQHKKERLEKFTYNVTFKDGDNIVYEEGFLDSGNVLYDTITKKPIILINFEVFHRLYSNINYINALTKNFDKKLVKDGHYVKINTIAGGTSILVFRVDEVKVGQDKFYKDAQVGLTFTGFEKSFGRRVLLNSAII